MSSSFTLTANRGLLNVLLSECGVSQAFDPAAGGAPPPIANHHAIWDTGATGCTITQKVVTACGLVATGMTRMHGVHGAQDVPTFLINLYLPNKVGIAAIPAALADLRGADVLIGMNVITMGDFAITNKNGNTIFTFRIPSIASYDYVKEHNASLRRFGNPKGPPQRPKHR